MLMGDKEASIKEHQPMQAAARTERPLAQRATPSLGETSGRASLRRGSAPLRQLAKVFGAWFKRQQRWAKMWSSKWDVLRLAAIFATTLFSLLAGANEPCAQSAEACGQLAELLGAIEKDADKITNQLARMDGQFGTWCDFGKHRTIPLFEDYLRRLEASRGNACFGANEQNVIDALRKHLTNVRKNVEEDCRRANRTTGSQAAGGTRAAEPDKVADPRTCLAPVRQASPTLYRLALRKNCQPVLAAFKSMASNGGFSCRTVMISTAGSELSSKRGFVPQVLGACYASANCSRGALRAAYCKN